MHLEGPDSARTFLISCREILLRRSFLLVAMNALYFGSIVVGAFLEQDNLLPLHNLPEGEGFLLLEAGLPSMIVGIFMFNLVVSSLFLTTLPGLLFFPLPVVSLVVRALFWGALLNWLPTSWLSIVLPTLVLEGEGYVLAGVSGVNLGLSLLRPDLAYEKSGFSRSEALKIALKEWLCLYGLVAGLLSIAAVAEAFAVATFGQWNL